MSNELSTREKTNIDDLPNEILGPIFHFSTFKCRDEGDEAYDPHSAALCTILVCKRWYAVGMNYPPLWNSVTNYEKHPLAYVKELFQRSKLEPLDVGQSSSYKHVLVRNDPRALPMLGSVLAQAARIRTLNLQLKGEEAWHLICKNFLRRPAPSLEYLNLKITCFRYYYYSDCPYPGPLLAGHAPKLRRLRLERCLIDLSLPLLSNLTELSLKEISETDEIARKNPKLIRKTAPTLLKLIQILQQMPALKYLNLDDCIVNQRSQNMGHDGLPIAHLPNLLSLTIANRFRAGAALAKQFYISTTCGIQLKFDYGKRQTLGDDFPKLLSLLENQLAHWPQDVSDRSIYARAVTGPRILFGNSKKVEYIRDVTEDNATDDHSQSDTSRDPLLRMILFFDKPEDMTVYFNRLLRVYISTYPTTTTLDLWLDKQFSNALHKPNPRLPPSLDILHSFSAVKTLNLWAWTPLYLLPLLKKLSPPGRPLLPELCSLHLSRVNFEEQKRAAYFAVFDFLKWRAEIDKPLDEVQFIELEGTLSEEAADELKRIGGVTVLERVGVVTVRK